MEVNISSDFNGIMTVKANGKLDIDSSAEFGMKVKDALDDNDDIKELVLDFAGITYIASIGLRVLLELFQQMHVNGTIRVINVQEPVLNVLKMTGFNKFLNIS